MATAAQHVFPNQALETYELDAAHSNVEFAVKHLMIATVKGRFAGLRGTILLDEENLSDSSVEVSIDAATIDTRQDGRDDHLRSADFLDVANHPEITFRSRKVEAISDERFRVVGELTIRGTTLEVVLDARLEGRVQDP